MSDDDGFRRDFSQFLGNVVHGVWEDLHDTQERAIQHYVWKVPLQDLQLVLAELQTLLNRGLSEEELEHFLRSRMPTGHYDGAGMTCDGWLRWIRDQIRRGVERKSEACQTLSTRGDSDLLVRRLREGLTEAERDPTFRRLESFLGGVYYHRWRRSHGTAEASIDYSAGELSVEELASVLDELELLLSRRYSENELEFIVHGTLGPSDFTPVPGATYEDALAWTRDHLRLRLEQRLAGEK